MDAWQFGLIVVSLAVMWVAGVANGYRTGRDARDKASSGKGKTKRGANCYDCGAPIIAADDDALICVQCGGRNRRVGHRVGSNPPAPVGEMLAPPAGPPWRNPSGLPIVREYPPMPKVQPPGSAIVAPLTAEEVRKIVREEIERALRPAGKSGKMGPG